MNTVILCLYCISLLITIPAIQSFNNYEKYEKYKIYEISFHNEQQYLLFNEKFKYAMDILTTSRTIERPISVLISHNHENEIVEYLKSNDINFHISNINVAESIRNENKLTFVTADIINFQSYQRFDVINTYLEQLQQQYPERIIVTTIGKSYEGRDLKTILITNNTQISGTKSLILIDGGIHAREWISPATALYVIQQLVENSTYYQQELFLYDWLIWPVVNPDGYEYSHDYDRLWRKTRRPLDPLSSSKCIGVDINRNFDYYWSYSGVSSNACSDNYPGLKAFSEPEAAALRDLFFRINSTCKMYLTLHSYGNYLLYPWGYERKLPSSWKYLDAVANAGAKAIKKATGTSYTVGGAANILYPASGASDDYAFAIANIPVVLCMELPSGGNGFDPPSNEILPIVEETWLGIRAMAFF